MIGWHFAQVLFPFVLMAASASAAETAGTQPAETQQLVRVQLADGQSLLVRSAVQEGDEWILVNAAGTTMRLPSAAVASTELVDATVREGTHEVWFTDRGRTHYLHAPSAMMLKRGEGYFAQQQLLFSSINFGVTDHLTLQVGSAIPALFSPRGGNVVAALKLGTSLSDALHVAAGVQTFVVSEFVGGFAFGVVTLGRPNAHISVAGGVPFYRSKWDQDTGNAIVVIAGNLRASQRFAFVTENWIFTGGNTFVMGSGALRIMGERLAADVGFVILEDMGVPFPWIGVNYHFGR